MSESKPLPKSIRFEADTAQKIQELGEIFNENHTRVLHRAVDYLYDNRLAAIDAEAETRKNRIKNNTK